MAQTDLKRLIENTAAETRRHFDVVAESIEQKVEGLAEAVTQLDEKLDRKIDTLEENMNRGFADTQAMLKFSHAELDRRLRPWKKLLQTCRLGSSG